MNNEMNTVLIGDTVYTRIGPVKATKNNLAEMQGAVNCGSSSIGNRQLLKSRHEVSGKSWMRSDAKDRRYFSSARTMGAPL